MARTVFLSSPTAELQGHRDSVRESIQRLEGWHVRSMEYFGAREVPPRDHCEAEVAQSDVVVVVQAGRYGSLVPGTDLSFTRFEYETAKRLAKPIFVFLERHQPGSDAHDSTELARTEEFRRELLRERVVDLYDRPEDLATRVVAAIHNWRHAREVENDQDHRPIPPQPNIVHPYPLEQHFTGREAERRRLTGWLDSGAGNVFVLEAIGGVGKTSLSWLWSQYDVLGVPLPGIANRAKQRLPPAAPVDGLFWWSFYETDSRFGSFLYALKRYIGQGRVGLSDDELFERLKRKKILVVLDGFERELMSYREGYRAELGDTPPDGDSKEARVCIEAAAASFLRALCSMPGLSSKFLITSRLFPASCEGYDGLPLPGCQTLALPSFSLADVVEFFGAYGIPATDSQIRQLTAKYGFHPLAVRLLAGVVKNDPFEPGDLGAAKGYDPIPRLVAKSHHVLQVAYDSLAPENQRLLSGVAAFRSVIGLPEIELVERANAAEARRPTRDKAALKAAVESLRSRNLLLFEDRRRVFDLHPVVRKYAYDRLVNKQAIHSSLGDYFESFAREVKVQDRADLTPVLELFHQLVQQERHSRALLLLRDRIYTPLVEQFHDVRTGLELCRQITAHPLDHMVTHYDLEYWFNRKCADLLDMAGLLRESLAWTQESDQKNLSSTSEYTGIYVLRQLGTEKARLCAQSVHAKALLGHLREAIDAGRSMLRAAGLLGVAGVLNVANELAFALDLAGDEQGALQLFQSRRLPATAQERLLHVRGLCYLSNMRLSGGEVREALALAKQAVGMLSPLSGVDHIEVVKEALLVSVLQAECESAGTDTPDHLTVLSKVVARSRDQGFGEIEVIALLSQARVVNQLGDRAAARHLAGLVETLAARADYRVPLIDAVLELASIAMAEGLLDEGRHRAELAKGLCVRSGDLPYARGLRRANALLRRTGLSSPAAS